MSDIRAKAQFRISKLLASIHHSLSLHPSVEATARDLDPADEELMAELEGIPFLYQTWVTLLAVDSYASSLMNHSRLQEQLSGLLTVVLENTKKVGNALGDNYDRKNVITAYHTAYQSLLETIQLSQEITPKSCFNEDQNLLIENSTVQSKAAETLLTSLREENNDLRRKLEANEQQLTNMEFKLTSLLKEHDECERDNEYQAGSAMSYVEMREELAYKQQEIERMNEEFSYEIQKYNTVYDAMKKELEDMKGYQNIDLIEQIEMLETEIVRMREEQERDQIIIRQLRSDNMMFSGGGYGSPRGSKRFAGSRFDY